MVFILLIWLIFENNITKLGSLFRENSSAVEEGTGRRVSHLSGSSSVFPAFHPSEIGEMRPDFLERWKLLTCLSTGRHRPLFKVKNAFKLPSWCPVDVECVTHLV